MPETPPLLTLDDAKAQLKIPMTTTVDDADITAKILEASATIVRYCKVPEDLWTEATVPPDVRACVKLFLTHLFENRGEEMSRDEDVWMAIWRILVRRRDPALA